MGFYPKTRVFANFAGHLSELFSVKENKKGDIYLILKALPRYTYGPLGKKESSVKNQKITVHPSRPSRPDVNTIKQSLLLDGDIAEMYYITSGISQNKFVSLYFRICPNLVETSYALRPDRRDKVIELCRIDGKKRNLLYGVFVTSSKNEVTLSRDKRIRQRVLTYKEFKIIVLYTYAYFPSNDDGELRYSMNRMMKVNGKAHDSEIIFATDFGLSRKEAEDLTVSQFKSLLEIGIKHGQKFCQENKIEYRFDLIRKLGFGFSRDAELRKKLKSITKSHR